MAAVTSPACTRVSLANSPVPFSQKSSRVIEACGKLRNRLMLSFYNEVGVNLKEGYNGDITARQAGSVGGMMVKKMIESYEKNMK